MDHAVVEARRATTVSLTAPINRPEAGRVPATPTEWPWPSATAGSPASSELTASPLSSCGGVREYWPGASPCSLRDPGRWRVVDLLPGQSRGRDHAPTSGTGIRLGSSFPVPRRVAGARRWSDLRSIPPRRPSPGTSADLRLQQPRSSSSSWLRIHNVSSTWTGIQSRSRAAGVTCPAVILWTNRRIACVVGDAPSSQIIRDRQITSRPGRPSGRSPRSPGARSPGGETPRRSPLGAGAGAPVCR